MISDAQMPYSEALHRRTLVRRLSDVFTFDCAFWLFTRSPIGPRARSTWTFVEWSQPLERDQKHLGAGATILFLLLLVSILPRCNTDGPDSIEIRTVEQHIQTNRVTVGNVTVEIRSADGTIAKEYSSVDDRVVVTSGATRVVVIGDQLTINDNQYGTAHDGAFILVDDTDVYIDNVQRMPNGAFAP